MIDGRPPLPATRRPLGNARSNARAAVVRHVAPAGPSSLSGLHLRTGAGSIAPWRPRRRCAPCKGRTRHGDLAQILTLKEPLGPPFTEAFAHTSREAFRQLYDETNHIHRATRAEDPSYIVGRKGSGKTAFLIGGALADDRDVVLVQSEHIYTEVNRLRSRYAAQNGTLVADSLVHVWEVLLFHAAMWGLARSERLANTQAKQRVWSYMSAFGDPMPLLLGAFICGRIAGMLLHALYPGLGGRAPVDWSVIPWVLVASAALVCASIYVVGARRFHDKRRAKGHVVRQSTSERTVMLLLGAAVALVAVGIVLPAVVHALGHTTDSLVVSPGLGQQPDAPVQRLLLGSVAVAAAVALGGAAMSLLRRRRYRLLSGGLAAISGSAILLVPFVLAAETATLRKPSLVAEGPVLVAAGLVILAFAVLAHNRRYSMHLFYRERIQEAFASRREFVAASNGDLPFTVEAIPYTERVLLSDVAASNAARPEPFPELIMCAAVAARGTEVPSKTWAASFTFEGRCSGNRRLGLHAPTTEVEAGDWIGGGGLTLPSMMAISGAAVSPLMGRFTVPAFRFLMAMLNIRLGVWIRNPGPNRPLDVELPPSSQPLRRLAQYILRGWREPGAWYVLKEGLGLADTRGRHVDVSDGGHWENLGLVELLRRRCSHIVVVDASGDPGLGDIARAMAVARAELGVEVDLDPRCSSPTAGNLAACPVAVGTFRYPDGDEGDIYYARSVLWDGAPADLHLFAAAEHLFPNHPTSNQFLSGELFDAYRALGSAVGDDLVAKVSLPPASFDEPRHGGAEAAARVTEAEPASVAP